ncbi:retinol dehydrogenase 14-like [Eriocheir sinensis]|uniref:retinol dehydrogenase 14-like n=1 Tax=Eriocheir sinensis TaxID=95602 RepID=UPI0021C7BCDE|nr:retinol dehydrogenase 14-like [Eriocheir sinensis]
MFVIRELRADAVSVGEVVVRRLDTSDLASVRTFAKEVLAAEKAINVLINNADRASSEKREMTADGLEMTMATNHFGQFLLTNLVLGVPKPTSVHKRLCNVLFTRELADRLAGTGVTANSLHSGVANTNIVTSLRSANSYTLYFLSFTHVFFAALIISAQCAALGAQTANHLASSSSVEGVTGRYFDHCEVT